MNWLAHVLLSEADAGFQLGNLLADLVRGEARARMPAEFRRGVDCHRAIDRFTDAHVVVRRSRARLEPPFRRFSGVLVDVFYDHLLAREWDRYVTVPLHEFTATFYREAVTLQLTLPVEASQTLQRIRQHDLLGAYADLEGVRASLKRLSLGLGARWQREFALERSVDLFERDLDAYASDFAEFFPELVGHIDAQWRIAHLVR